MKLQEFNIEFSQKMAELKEMLASDALKTIIGVEAVNHFKESFANEGFTSDKLEKWKEVQRRNPESPWYGHSGQLSAFSQSRTLAKILSGETGELQNSIRYVSITNGVRIVNATPYAAVHQFGLPAKVYGKKEFVMPARPFMGASPILQKNIQEKIEREINKILKK